MVCGSEGIIPAYAGSTSRGPGKAVARSDHPRIRGEHAGRVPSPGRPLGSSPHTRGARPTRSSYSGRRRIIPAYAGSTFNVSSTFPSLADHPRIRGEHVPEAPVLGADIGSSPHTRGALLLERRLRNILRIIPAYAGSTASRTGSSPSHSDHPRIRGEHFLTYSASTSISGSSPHTRGARALRPGG